MASAATFLNDLDYVPASAASPTTEPVTPRRRQLASRRDDSLTAPDLHGILEAAFIDSASSADQPEWMRATLGSIEKLLQLPPNWNSRGAAQISRSAVTNALQLLAWAAAADAPTAAFIPTAPGGVQVEWHAHGLDIELYVPPSGYAAGLFFQDHEEGVEREVTLGNDISELTKALDVLTQRAREAQAQ